MKRLIFFLTAVLFAATWPASGRVNFVTLPGRNSVQLTIYNSVDLTLVKESRVLTFKKGRNRLEFSWANTLIDPTSLDFRALTHADQIEVVDVRFPPRVANTLEWQIQSEIDGEVQIEIRYFTSGISWSADYVLDANPTENQAFLAGSVRVVNNSGEDYENAQVRLVVGVIKMVEEVARLARNETAAPSGSPETQLRSKKEVRMLGAMLDSASAVSENRPREIIKEGLSEYFVYTVEGRDTIPNGWSKKLPSFNADAVPLRSYYKYERERWGDQVMRYYRFKNDEKSHLGAAPLPNGALKACRVLDAANYTAFAGSADLKYVPVGEEVDLELGPDSEVQIKPILKDWTKTDIRFDNHGNVNGWTVKEAWEITFQNSREIPITCDARRNFSGDWSIDATAAFEKVDANKVKFIVPLNPREKKTVRYEVTTRLGVNATK
jgi:hypothetical protein